jgi:hypothetical protein
MISHLSQKSIPPSQQIMSYRLFQLDLYYLVWYRKRLHKKSSSGSKSSPLHGYQSKTVTGIPQIWICYNTDNMECFYLRYEAICKVKEDCIKEELYIRN